MLDEFTDPELTSLVLKRVPPRCTSTVLLDMLDACGGLYDFVHLPYDIRHHKNLSLAFINFLDHETARAAFAWLSEHSNFPQGLAPSTQVHRGHVHGLGPNLSHFVARFGMNALDPPYAPYVFIDGRSVPRSRDVVTRLVTPSMLRQAETLVTQRESPGDTMDELLGEFWRRPQRLSNLNTLHFADLRDNIVRIESDFALFRF